MQYMAHVFEQESVDYVEYYDHPDIFSEAEWLELKQISELMRLSRQANSEE